MTPILAIDPGASGGFAWTDIDGNVSSSPMPEGMSAQADWLRGLVAERPTMTAVIEKVGTYMPGNSGPAAATFARHCGHLEAICYVLGIPTQQVMPGKWQKHLGAMPAEKPERKRHIKELMARRFPHLTVTLKTADALGILCYAMDDKKSETTKGI